MHEEQDREPYEPLAATAAGAIFKVVRDRGPLSAVDIVKRTGLAKSTVSVYLDKLIDAGLVREDPVPGAKRHKLKVAESAGYVAGVDLGQNHLAVGLCDLEADVVDSIRHPIDLASGGPEGIVALIAASIKELSARNGLKPGDLFGVGVGIPGPVDYAYGIPIAPPVMPGWDRYPLASSLAGEFGCPVFVDNDVNVMALAERDKSVSEREDDFVLVKLGSGIGAGIVVGRRIYRGAKGAAGDIGHVALDGDDTLCRCGNRGCLEAVAGGRALRQAAEAEARSGSGYLGGLAGAELGLDDLARGAALGDERCLEIVIRAGKRVGDVLAKIVNFFNPSLIIVNGGMVRLGERYVASIRESVYSRSTPLATSELVIRKSTLADRAGIIGSAVLVLDEIFSHANVGKLLRRSAQQA